MIGRMAFSAADIESFIAALRDDPQLRDRVRDAILADDFLALPGIVRDLGQSLNGVSELLGRLTERMDQLTQRVDQLAVRVDDLVDQVGLLVAETKSLNGRVGNLEGWRYETQYANNLPAHLMPDFRRSKLILPGNFEPLIDALDDGRITRAEWDDVMKLDVVASARTGREPDAPELLLAIELSIFVDDSDVERAHRRAQILRKAGLEVEACVDGDVIGQAARRLATQLGVRVLHARELSAA
jgi:hypothetical protein